MADQDIPDSRAARMASIRCLSACDRSWMAARPELVARYAAARGRLETVTDELAALDPGLAALRSGDPMTWPDVEQVLARLAEADPSRGVLLVQYYVRDEMTGVVGLRPGRAPELVSVVADRQAVAAAGPAVLQQLVAPLAQWCRPGGGAPLPFGGDQVEAIAELFRARDLPAAVRIGPQATAPAVLADLAGAQGTGYLHLAVHGVVQDGDGLASGVQLADRRLSAAELLAARLPRRLVVLAACSSGVGQRRPGDELLGLTTSVLAAGTATVLTALWPVQELPASLLMLALYRHLRTW